MRNLSGAKIIRTNSLRTPGIILGFLLLVGWTPVSAQVQSDSLQHYELDDVVVTAKRTPSTIRTSASAVTRLDDSAIATMPTASVASMLEMIPGFNFLWLDGLGYDPQVTVRGFYGGGEAEYVTLMVDGRPVNSIERGLIDWNLLSGIDIEAVEAVRGSVSSLYGDVTVGGIINVRSRSAGARSTALYTSGGSYGTFEGAVSHAGNIDGRSFSVRASATKSDGYRDHAERMFVNIGGAGDLYVSGQTRVKLDTRHYWANSDTPGPVAADVEVDDTIRRSSSALYRFDDTEERRNEIGLTVERQINQQTNVNGSVFGAIRSVDERVTLELFPGFGDTQERAADSRRAGASALIRRRLGKVADVTLGGDASFGQLDNSWYSFLTGSIDSYADTSGVERGPLQSSSDISRRSGALYLSGDVDLAEGIKLTSGLRFDVVSDSFNPTGPDTGSESADRTHTAWSPRLGLNARLVASEKHVTNVYGSVSGSFKTATLDQLYDQRQIPFGEFSISLSNEDLVPQEGTGVEAGLYHTFVDNGIEVSSSLALYRIQMKNELDFDLATFSYTNLGKSLHQGIEAGATAAAGGFTGFLNYTLQHVTLEFGANEGNFVKAIPQTLVVTGMGYKHPAGVGGSVRVRHSRDAYLDDENTIELPAYVVTDAKVFAEVNRVRLDLTVGNLLGVDYSTTGYLLSVEGLGSQLYMYPAAGRTVKLSLGVRL